MLSVDREGIKKKKDIEEVRNPFLGSLVIRAVRMNRGGSLSFGMDYKKEDGVLLLKEEGSFSKGEYSTSFLVEQDVCSRVYVKGMRGLLLSLEGNEKTLLLYIICFMRPVKEVIKINVKDVMEKTGMGSSSVYAGVEGLIEKGVIARFKAMEYWINPSLLYSGNRMKKYRDNIEIIATAKKDKK